MLLITLDVSTQYIWIYLRVGIDGTINHKTQIFVHYFLHSIHLQIHIINNYFCNKSICQNKIMRVVN